MNIFRSEALALLELMGEVTIDKIDTAIKRKVVLDLLATADEPANMFVLRGVDGKTQKVEAIKTIRALTGTGLKEAKDMYDGADPHGIGGDIGPFPLPNTFREALVALDDAHKRFQWNSSIVVDPA